MLLVFVFGICLFMFFVFRCRSMTCSQIGLKNIPKAPSEPRLAIPARSAEATASRNDSAKSKPFNLKAKPFLHNMDLERNLRLH